MLNSNSENKKSIASVFMCFAILFSALNFGCCLRNSAVAVGDIILRDNEAESEDDFPCMHTYAYSDPPGENEQEQIDTSSTDNERNIQTLLTAVNILGEIARLPHDQQGEVLRNVSPLDIYIASRMIADDCTIC